ncbi:hypothetical protein BX666DRAFT_1913480 [Dichotomocladium elegans]|nr:hypothetical protein BX666DRAFT_1913480 [Dichotomocladium elegans]
MASNSWQLGFYPFMRHHLFPSHPFTNQARASTPVDVIKFLYDNPPSPSSSVAAGGAEDSASNSSSSGCTMDSVDSGPHVRRCKKRSQHMLLREIRRLRAENDGLRNMVDTIKEDLRYERESRQISEQCHLKYYTSSCDRQLELEDDVADKQKLIDDLKLEIEELKSRSPSPSPTLMTPYYNNTSSSSSSSRAFACFDFDDHDMLCQPISSESATPDRLVIDSGSGSGSEEDADNDDENDDDNDDDDDDDDDGLTDNQRFEQLAASYLHQAILSKLTSARANLELDDLMLKYDPSPAVVLKTLANAFIAWIDNTIASSKHGTFKEIWTSSVIGGFLAFWKAILGKHIHDEDDMAQFLNEAEHYCLQQRCDRSQDKETPKALVENYQSFLILLYKYDIVDAEAISAWWRVTDHSGLVADRLRDVTSSFIKWLEEDEDEEDDENDDDDDDDDDDEDVDEKADNSDSDTVIDYVDDGESVREDNRALDNMLEGDRKYCVCQFETSQDASPTPPVPSSPPHPLPPPAYNTYNNSNLLACKCDYIYTPSPPPAYDKPKKTVRIIL